MFFFKGKKIKARKPELQIQIISYPYTFDGFSDLVT